MSTNDPFGDDLAVRLESRLRGTLPGRRAQKPYAPELSYGRQFGPPSYAFKQAAVVALIYPVDRVWRLLLTLRSACVADHANQICLPGGAVEAGETNRLAALRELDEEMGIASGDVQFLGRLSAVYLFVSNYQVTPWVAFMQHQPAIRPNRLEVAEVLEMPLTALVDRKNRGRDEVQRRGFTMTVPRIAWQGHGIWGGTAMILGELIAVLVQCTNQSART